MRTKCFKLRLRHTNLTDVRRNCTTRLSPLCVCIMEPQSMTMNMGSSSMKNRRYSDVIQLATMQERYEYLKLSNEVGSCTFGSNRFLNQAFYSSPEWKKVRQEVILRDGACDLAIPEFEIFSNVTIHHINPITIDDVKDENWDKLLDPDNLITTSYTTHKAIHFGTANMLPRVVIERKPNDTKSW